MANRNLDLSKLKEVEQYTPESAERILRLAECEAAHRVNQEQADLCADIAARRRGQWLGATISIIALLGAIVTALAGAHPTVSIALVGIPILASAKAIIWPATKLGECR